MKIGLISDTHDNVAAVEAAIQRFNELDLEVVLHCGDLVAPFILEIFRTQLKAKKFYFVFGNNDGERAGLMKKALESDGKLVCLGGEGGMVELAGKKIFMIHESPLAQLVARSGQFDYCFGGHDHVQRREEFVADGSSKKTIFVNPGNLVNKKAGEIYKSWDHCCCVVDLSNGTVDRIDL